VKQRDGAGQGKGLAAAPSPETHPGSGRSAVYMDRQGGWLKGELSYKLLIPPHVLVKDFWSVAVYDIDTWALIETDQHLAEINPNVAKLDMNTDGSIDLYFAPTMPDGKGANWIKTIPGKAWFIYFRWYGQQKPITTRPGDSLTSTS